MIDVESLIRKGLVDLDPLPPGAKGDWLDVLGRARRPAHRRRWALAVVAATAAAAVVAAVLALLPAGGGGPTPAAAALDRLANLVAAQSLTPQPGQYLYIESRSDYGSFLGLRGGGFCETRAIERREIWIGTDGSGLIRATYGPAHFSSAADRATCLNADPKMQLQGGSTSNDWFAPQCLSLVPLNGLDWSSLSSDPQVLLQQILPKSPGRQWTSFDKFRAIEDFLHDTDAPPAVRATLYQAAALIPGIQLLGTVRDHDGRPGLGIALRGAPGSPGSVSELIFDQQTGELLGEQGTGPGPDGYWEVYLHRQVVNALPGKPPAPLGPQCTKDRNGSIAHDVPGGSITNGAPRQ